MMIWDSFIRLYHWLQLILLCGLWWSGESGEMVWHFRLAYLLLALWLTRIVWGFIGNDYARFSQFLTGPKAVWHYISGRPDKRYLGHNPAAGYMILLMLLVMGIQLFTGLTNADELFAEGPLSPFIAETELQIASKSLAQWLAWLHEWNFKLLQLLAAIHIGVVLGLRIAGEDLITPMLTGYKKVAPPTKETQLKPLSSFGALLLFLVLAIVFQLAFPIPY